MAPSYKLTYFDIPGRAEPIRLIFHYANVAFEDIRLAREDFQKIKPTLPFGQLPVLEVDGVVYNQSTAISRYLAKQFGLAGQNDQENLLIDAMIDNMADLERKSMDARMTKDEDKKSELKQKLVDEILPQTLSKLEAVVQKNGGYLALNKITWADIWFLPVYEKLRGVSEENVFAKYPGLIRLKDTILQNPGIRNHIQNSKPNPMSKYQLKSEL